MIIIIIPIYFISSAFSKLEIQAALQKRPTITLKSNYMTLEKTIQQHKSNSVDNNNKKSPNNTLEKINKHNNNNLYFYCYNQKVNGMINCSKRQSGIKVVMIIIQKSNNDTIQRTIKHNKSQHLHLNQSY